MRHFPFIFFSVSRGCRPNLTFAVRCQGAISATISVFQLFTYPGGSGQGLSLSGPSLSLYVARLRMCGPSLSLCGSSVRGRDLFHQVRRPTLSFSGPSFSLIGLSLRLNGPTFSLGDSILSVSSPSLSLNMNERKIVRE